MKTMFRIIGAVSVGISLLAASSALAGGGYGGGHGGGSFGGGHGGGGYGGYHDGGYRGGGYYGGYHGGYGWGGLGFAVGFGWPYYYYDYPATYYYAPQTVVYSAQPEVIYTTPTVNYSSQPASTPTAAPSVQYQSVQPNPQKPSMTVADIKALTTGGLSDVVILSQIRSSHAVFNLSTEEIIDLNTSKVSQKVIEAMINTGGQH